MGGEGNPSKKDVPEPQNRRPAGSRPPDWPVTRRRRTECTRRGHRAWRAPRCPAGAPHQRPSLSLIRFSRGPAYLQRDAGVLPLSYDPTRVSRGSAASGERPQRYPPTPARSAARPAYRANVGDLPALSASGDVLPEIGRGTAELVKGFGCRPMATVGRAPGPASESLQGRNPRVLGSEGAARAMGISP